MLITGFATVLVMTAAAPPRRADCVAIPIPMVWHDGAAHRDQHVRDLRIDQDWRPRPRCFRLSAR